MHTLPNLEDALALPCVDALLTSGTVEESLTAVQFATIEATLKGEAAACISWSRVACGRLSGASRLFVPCICCAYSMMYVSTMQMTQTKM